MKKFGVTVEKVNAISYAVSEYVNGLGDRDWIEGIFVMPCGEDTVDTVVLGIVYNNWRMGSRIQQSNKNRLHMLSGGVGIGLQVKDISLDKCLDYFSYRNYDQPIKSMIKTGYIIYDSKGRLQSLQEQFQQDPSIESLERRGAVEMEPAIQYKKAMHRF